jgi:hypothetical protein
MGYWEQSVLSQDIDFIHRVASCAAVERPAEDALSWAANNSWRVSAAPGFADAYSSALAGGVPNPGRDPSVISDGQILSAVQGLTAAT